MITYFIILIIINLVTVAITLRLLMYCHGIDMYMKIALVNRFKNEKTNKKSTTVTSDIRPYKTTGGESK